jgi:hypothetical protein
MRAKRVTDEREAVWKIRDKLQRNSFQLVCGKVVNSMNDDVVGDALIQ